MRTLTPFARDLARRLGRCGLQPITCDGFQPLACDGFQPLAAMVAITYWIRHPHKNRGHGDTPVIIGLRPDDYKSWLIWHPD